MAVETALDWFRRSSKKRRRHRHSNKSGPNNNDVDDDDESLNATITTATDAAWTFLRYGRSGIAPIDAAWKRCRNDERQRQRHRPKDRYQPLHEQNCLPPPPVVVLEGPRDVGKTWMLLTLAARYVVETRASKFDNVVGNKDAVDTDDTDGTENNNEESDNNNKSESRPKVLLLDSSYDFSISQLVYVVQQRLRLVHQQQHQETISANDNVDNHDGHNGEQQQEQQQQQQQQQHKSLEQRQLEEELERQERGRLSFEKDMEDCLSRIHIIQVDDGSTWVPMLEALTHQLSDDNRRNGNSNSTSNDNLPRETDPSFSSSSAAPILLLWDGFLSDLIVANSTMTTSAGGGSNIIMSNNSSNNNNAYQNTLFDSPGSRELLRQVSRLLEKQRDTLWWVLTTRTSSSTTATATTAKNAPFTSSIENYGIGFRVAEWIRKEEERRELQQQKEQERQQHQLQQQQNNHTGFVQRRQLHQNHDQKQPPQRKTYRVRLDRRSSISSSSRSITTMGMATLFAKVITSRSSSSIASNEYNNKTNNYINDVDGGENIPYSLSLEGILS